jgi:uncharacterized protein (TIGR02147 family)
MVLIIKIIYSRGMPNIFEFDSYKSFLIEALKTTSNSRGFQARMARAAGCQPSYLNQALHSKVELTPDHGVRLAKFLELNSRETDHFLNLLHLSRASSPELRSFLSCKIEEGKAAQKSLGNRLSSHQSLQLSSIHHEYYSSWLWMTVHVSLCVEKYSTVQGLSERFKIGSDRIRHILESLRAMGLAKEERGKWRMTETEIHLPAGHFMNNISHRNWRDKACLEASEDRAESVHYSSVFSLSRTDAEKLRHMILKFIDQSRETIKASPSEEVFCMLCDFFEV